MASMSCYSSWLAMSSSCSNYKKKMMMKNKLSSSTRQQIYNGVGGRLVWLHECASKSEMMAFKCCSAKQDVDDFEMDYRLFSNLNQSTFKREPGIFTYM